MVEVIPCSAALLVNSAFSLSINIWYVPQTVFSVILLQGMGLSSSIGLLVRISLTALLAASIAELGIESASGPSGFGSTLCIFFSFNGSICFKYFRSAIFQNMKLHANTNNGVSKKYFQKCLMIFEIFKNYSFKNFLLYGNTFLSFYTMLEPGDCFYLDAVLKSRIP